VKPKESPASSGKTPRAGRARQNRSRRIRALLAAGMVFGIGATTTLAAWNDQEYAQGTITAASFALESNGGSGNFAASSADNPRPLVYGAPFSAIFPGQSTFALLQVRTATGSIAGTIQFRGAAENPGPLAQYLTYGVRALPTGSACTAATFDAASNIVVPAGASLGTASTTTQTVVANGASTANSTVNYCVRVTMRPDAANGAQGLVGNPRWVIEGTSVSG